MMPVGVFGVDADAGRGGERLLPFGMSPVPAVATMFWMYAMPAVRAAAYNVLGSPDSALSSSL